jgi:hypothetical protein
VTQRAGSNETHLFRTRRVSLWFRGDGATLLAPGRARPEARRRQRCPVCLGAVLGRRRSNERRSNMKRNAYTTMQAARSLRERHADASPSHVAVALALATFADGPTGAMIRPGAERIARMTGLNIQTVYRRVRWLVQRGELRRDKHAWRVSAACYTWVGGMVVPESRNAGASRTTHQSHPSQQSGLPGPTDLGVQFRRCAVCGGPLGYLIEDDEDAPGAQCAACFQGH